MTARRQGLEQGTNDSSCDHRGRRSLQARRRYGDRDSGVGVTMTTTARSRRAKQCRPDCLGAEECRQETGSIKY